MRFCWTLAPANSYDYENMLEHEVRYGNTTNLKKAVEQLDTSDELKRLLLLGIDKQNTKDYDVFVSEVCAALDYANKFSHVGRMRKVRKAVAHNLYVENEVVEFLKRELVKFNTFDYTCWFKLRSLCMDMYTIARMLSDDYHSAIFYGGNQHTSNVAGFFESNMNFTEVQPPESITKLSEKSELLTCKSFRFPNSDKQITFLGENHSKTTHTFGEKLIAYLNSQCSVNQQKKTYFYVEKHIEEKNENSVPSKLACNMNIPIHNVRCNKIMTTECTALKQVCLDSRHYDMGFLRFEIFEFCKNDGELSALTESFMKKSLTEMWWLAGVTKSL